LGGPSITGSITIAATGPNSPNTRSSAARSLKGISLLKPAIAAGMPKIGMKAPSGLAIQRPQIGIWLFARTARCPEVLPFSLGLISTFLSLVSMVCVNQAQARLGIDR
jgi:hypothetical protein